MAPQAQTKAPAAAVTLVSTAAGFAGTANRNCFGDANIISTEITYAAEPFGCQRQAFDGGGGDRPPTLTLTPVPVPPGMLLLGSGALALGSLRRLQLAARR